jgi:hypothetical protein
MEDSAAGTMRALGLIVGLAILIDNLKILSLAGFDRGGV